MIVKTGDGKEQEVTVAIAKDSVPAVGGGPRRSGLRDASEPLQYEVLSDIVYDGERHFTGKDTARVPAMSASRGAVVLLNEKDARALLARGAVRRKE